VLALPCLGGTTATENPTGAGIYRPVESSMVNCGTEYAVVHDSVWNQGIPAGAVHDYPYEFTLVLDQERDDDETPMEDYVSVCLHCLIDEHPELGRPIDLARRTGSASRIDGSWHAYARLVSA
jgi:hypothetical protein